VLDARWQRLRPGDVIPDWGGRDETFTVAAVEAPRSLVHTSRRGSVDVSWALVLTSVGGGRTRLHLRLRLRGVRRRWLAESVGGTFDLLTVAGLAAGLEERVRDVTHKA
jgi:hypothetical protein